MHRYNSPRKIQNKQAAGPSENKNGTPKKEDKSSKESEKQTNK